MCVFEETITFTIFKILEVCPERDMLFVSYLNNNNSSYKHFQYQKGILFFKKFYYKIKHFLYKYSNFDDIKFLQINK